MSICGRRPAWRGSKATRQPQATCPQRAACTPFPPRPSRPSPFPPLPASRLPAAAAALDDVAVGADGVHGARPAHARPAGGARAGEGLAVLLDRLAPRGVAAQVAHDGSTMSAWPSSARAQRQRATAGSDRSPCAIRRLQRHRTWHVASAREDEDRGEGARHVAGCHHNVAVVARVDKNRLPTRQRQRGAAKSLKSGVSHPWRKKMHRVPPHYSYERQRRCRHGLCSCLSRVVPR